MDTLTQQIYEQRHLARLQLSIDEPGTESEKLERSRLCGMSRRKITELGNLLGMESKKARR